MSFNFFHNLAEIARNGGFFLSDEHADSTDLGVDWRFIASIDIHSITKESNFEKLDECIPFLIRSSLNNLLNTRVLDPAIGKIFTLSQLSLQYLLFCTKFLDKSVSSLRENIYSYQKRNLDLQDALRKREGELETLVKRLKKRQEVFSCEHCPKNFESQLLLDSHVSRRHKEQNKDQNLISTIKLEIENKELKEKLNLTEKELMEAKIAECQKCLKNESRIFKSIGIQINSEEKEKDDMEKEDTLDKFNEFNETIRKMMAEQLRQFQEYKENDEKKYKQEISELKDMLDKAVKTFKQHEMKPPPLPAPRLTVGIQASENLEDACASQKTLNTQRENENLWKTRFKELETMYEHNQMQMAQSMKDLERAYSEKLTSLEESVKLLQNEKISPSVKTETVLSKIPEKEIIPQVRIEKHKDTSTSSSEDEILDLQTPKNVVHEVIECNPIDKKIKMPTSDNKKKFSAQKFLIREKSSPRWFGKKAKQDSKLTEVPTKDNNQINREEAENMFQERLKEFKVDKNLSNMSQKNIDEIQAELINRREINKKVHPPFFITRKKIKARVDQLFKNYIPKSANSKPNRSSLSESIQKVAEEHFKHLEERPKKKVLFNIDEHSVSTVRSNEDSDFDITSLEDDIK